MWGYLCFLLLIVSINSHYLRFLIAPGAKECFYNKFEQDEAITITFFVTKGKAADLVFVVKGPNQLPIAMDKESGHGEAEEANIDIAHWVYANANATMAGEFTVCFSNERSWSEKEVTVETNSLVSDFKKAQDDSATVKDLTVFVRKLIELEKALQTVSGLVFENQILYNYNTKNQINCDQWMSYLGGIETFIISAVVLFQIRTVRSWFNTKANSRVHV